MRLPSHSPARGGPDMCTVAVPLMARGIRVYAPDHQEAERDHDHHPKQGHGGIAAHPFEVDRDGNRLGDTRVVTGEKQRAAELAHSSGEGEHGSGRDGGPGERHHEPAKDTHLRPAERAGGVDHAPVERLECAEGRAVHERKAHHDGRDDRRLPREDDRDAVRYEPATHGRGLPEQHEQQEAADRGGQHHRDGEDRIEDALETTRRAHDAPCGEQPQREGDGQRQAAGLERYPKWAVIDGREEGEGLSDNARIVFGDHVSRIDNLGEIAPQHAVAQIDADGTRRIQTGIAPLGIRQCHSHIARAVIATRIEAIPEGTGHALGIRHEPEGHLSLREHSAAHAAGLVERANHRPQGG